MTTLTIVKDGKRCVVLDEHIKSLRALHIWVIDRNPDIIWIPEGHPITEIWELGAGPKRWAAYQGIPIEYITVNQTST